MVFRDEALMKKVRGVLHYLGGTMDPHQAWLVLRGIKTLAMRVRTAQENAHALAQLLADHPAVELVRYPGLPGHPQAELIARQMAGPGSLISFDLKGGIEAGRKVLGSRASAGPGRLAGWGGEPDPASCLHDPRCHGP